MTPAIEKLRESLDAKLSEIADIGESMRSVDEGAATIAGLFDSPDALAGGRALLEGVLASDGGEQPFAIGPSWPDPTAITQALFLLLGRDHVEKQARALLTARMGSHTPLSAGERSAQLAKLRRELRELEVREEREILKAEGNGFIPRRAEADAKVILGVWATDL